MVEAKVIVPADHPDGNRDSFRTPGTLLRAVHVQRPASSPAPASRRPELHTPTLCGLGRESFQAHSWGVLWRLRILFPWVPTACRRNGRCTTPWHGYRRCSGSQARCPPVGASAVRASCSTFSATGRRCTTCDTTRSTLTSACCHLLASRCMTKRQRGPKPPLPLPGSVCRQPCVLRRRRTAPATTPRPASSIARDAGSGTAATAFVLSTYEPPDSGSSVLAYTASE
jgi:hypothetical protein